MPSSAPIAGKAAFAGPAIIRAFSSYYLRMAEVYRPI
jgi:hypothetical protein